MDFNTECFFSPEEPQYRLCDYSNCCYPSCPNHEEFDEDEAEVKMFTKQLKDIAQEFERNA